jgi:hypothetical protein
VLLCRAHHRELHRAKGTELVVAKQRLEPLESAHSLWKLAHPTGAQPSLHDQIVRHMGYDGAPLRLVRSDSEIVGCMLPQRSQLDRVYFPPGRVRAAGSCHVFAMTDRRQVKTRIGGVDNV